MKEINWRELPEGMIYVFAFGLIFAGLSAIVHPFWCDLWEAIASVFVGLTALVWAVYKIEKRSEGGERNG